MPIEPLKILKIIRPRGDAVDILTRMPEKELLAELKFDYRFEPDPEHDPIWASFEALNSMDERVVAVVAREDIRAYFIMPFHPAPQQRVERPAILQ